ncbi:Organic solute transporter Ost-alpha [Artemisia annua]|uniref:Organic solute transporter Ost-alpha n=1 Tax=Artemisia annua TaxID=35608 RepID=A0A2U1M035_ARTAN|nr:Organic solute transporter Ost-alpha [Artemisia annua]
MDESTHAELRTIALIIAACFVLVALILSSVLIVQHLKFYTNPEKLNMMYVMMLANSLSSMDESTHAELRTIALIIAACFVLVALILSSVLIVQHLKFYTNPEEQKWIVGVLLMVPIYASESILSLWQPKFALAAEILRSCYEAFALYSFGSYLIACLGGEQKVAELLENEKEKLLKKPLLDGKDVKPDFNRTSICKFFRQPRVLGEGLLQIEKFGLVQYMIFKVLCSFVEMILELFGVYGDGEFKLYYGYPYVAFVMNFSQMWALYCLVKFYYVTHERLQPIRPLAKFISFKAIVFATWWQGVGIALLCYLNVLPKQGRFQTELQDFLICIEMAIAAVAHVFVFSAKPYHFLPASKYGQVSTSTIKEFVKVEEGDEDKPAVIEKTETQVEAPGTSVTESVHEIVVEGGQHVVDDVKMTLNQAYEPVGKGMTKIQETIHHLSVGDDDKKSEIEVDEYEKDVTKIGPDGSGEDNDKIEVRVEKDEEVSRNGTHLTRQTSEVTVEYKHG